MKMTNNINGFYKVQTNGGTYVTATFYNPTTNEEFNKTIYDYDDDRVAMYAGDYYNLPLLEDNNPIKIQWLHKHGVILNGDKVIIKRGRKMLNEIKVVKSKYTFVVEGTYGHGDVDYLRFEDGTKCAEHNCNLYLD